MAVANRLHYAPWELFMLLLTDYAMTLDAPRYLHGPLFIFPARSVPQKRYADRDTQILALCSK